MKLQASQTFQSILLHGTTDDQTDIYNADNLFNKSVASTRGWTLLSTFFSVYWCIYRLVLLR